MTPPRTSTTWRTLAVGAATTAALTLTPLAAPAHASPGPASVSAREVRPAAGSLAVVVDLATFQATPTPSGERCVLGVDVDLDLTGTLVGTADGRTTATVDAPCAQATTTPPGTYADAFRFTGTFTGTVAGAAVTADVTYAGLTRAGGRVSAVLVLGGGADVVAAVDAQAGVGGTYRGVVVTHR